MKGLISLPLYKIQARRSGATAKIVALCHDMEQNGQREPITVHRIAGDRFAIEDGLHRFRAANALDWSALDAIVL